MTRGSDKCRRMLGGEKQQGQICRRGVAPRWFPERSKPPSQPAQPAAPAAATLKSESGSAVWARREGRRRPPARSPRSPNRDGRLREQVWLPCAPIRRGRPRARPRSTVPQSHHFQPLPLGHSASKTKQDPFSNLPHSGLFRSNR